MNTHVLRSVQGVGQSHGYGRFEGLEGSEGDGIRTGIEAQCRIGSARPASARSEIGWNDGNISTKTVVGGAVGAFVVEVDWARVGLQLGRGRGDGNAINGEEFVIGIVDAFNDKAGGVHARWDDVIQGFNKVTFS